MLLHVFLKSKSTTLRFYRTENYAVDIGVVVTILYKIDLNIKKVKTAEFVSFEVVTCSIKLNFKKLAISTSYHPGYSSKQRHTYAEILLNSHLFCVHFLLKEIHAEIGDFSICCETLKRTETKAIYELLQANKLNQLISEPIHAANGILDLLEAITILRV